MRHNCIPTALSQSEVMTLREVCRNRSVVEAGALLGHSTVEIARVASHLTTIDKHCGYGPSTWNAFMRNLDYYAINNAQVVRDDALQALRQYAGDVTFIDLDGTHSTTLRAIQAARSPIVCVHDFGRANCRGVESAIYESGLTIIRVTDTLAVCGRTGK